MSAFCGISAFIAAVTFEWQSSNCHSNARATLDAPDSATLLCIFVELRLFCRLRGKHGAVWCHLHVLVSFGTVRTVHAVVRGPQITARVHLFRCSGGLFWLYYLWLCCSPTCWQALSCFMFAQELRKFIVALAVWRGVVPHVVICGLLPHCFKL